MVPRPTSVLHVFKYFAPDFTGEGIYATKMFAHLQALGIDNEVLVKRSHPLVAGTRTTRASTPVPHTIHYLPPRRSRIAPELQIAWWVIRLMIDREQQGKGYGRAAMQAVITRMVDEIGCDEIVTSFNPENMVAANLYASLGFLPTGEWEDGEPLVVLRVADHPAAAEEEGARTEVEAAPGARR